MFIFQFHKGAIGVALGRGLVAISQNFNSIKVRLEFLMLDFYKLGQLYFNSIKVRLE